MSVRVTARPWNEVARRLLAGPTSFPLVESLFLRLLGLTYLAAFGSLWVQVLGLFGSRGIVPAAQQLSAMRTELGSSIYPSVPTLFWFGISDRILVWSCTFGCAGALLLVIGLVPRISAIFCWSLYLSLFSFGTPFMN